MRPYAKYQPFKLKDNVYRVPNKTDKLLLALQFWDGDAPQAYRLAKILADIEPAHCQEADLLLVHRFDHRLDNKVVEYVRRKFNVYTHKCPRKGTGWPMGCNDLWLGTMDWIYQHQTRLSPYKAAFTFEGDGAPLCLDWIRRLSEAWNACPEPCFVAGHWVEHHPRPHINGNALFSCHPTFLKWISTEVVTVNTAQGWDYYLAPNFKQWGQAKLPQIRSFWASKTVTPEWFQTELNLGTVWFHGCKDDSLHELVSKHLLRR